MKKKTLLNKMKKIDIDNIQKEILKLKKEVILLNIKLKTKQKIKYHLIKQKKYQIAQLLTLETLYLN